MTITKEEKEILIELLTDLYWHENNMAYKCGGELGREKIDKVAKILAKLTKGGAK